MKQAKNIEATLTGPSIACTSL